jgi:hypothetical protein
MILSKDNCYLFKQIGSEDSWCIIIETYEKHNIPINIDGKKRAYEIYESLTSQKLESMIINVR